MIRVVSIQFHPAGKLYDFNAGNLVLKPGQRVIVETERGLGLGTVVIAPLEKDESLLSQTLSSVQRLLEPEDETTLEHLIRREKEAFDFCLHRIKERSMDMKLVRVEHLFDGSKIIFYFTADGRVDFRELVKDLAHTFHTRIEMRQIGVRDEAKMVGGLGICGRELCCSLFLRDFQAVSVKMAKEQNLALNPSKISGQCGRLLCCLDYEYETYCDLRKDFPRCGKRACTLQYNGIVEKMNILTGEITLHLDDGKLINIHIKELIDEQPQTITLASNIKATEQLSAQSAKEQQPASHKQQKQQQAQSLSSTTVTDASVKNSFIKHQSETTVAKEQQRVDDKPRRKKRNRRNTSNKTSEQKTDKPNRE